MAKVTCRNCKKQIDKESAILFRPRLSFCSEQCQHEWQESEDGQEDALLDYVYNLYSPPKQTPETYVMLKKQATYYHNTYNLKYKGMLLSFKYYIEVLEKWWNDEYGMGQVLPTIYAQLQQMYKEQRALKSKLSNINIDDENKIVIGRKQPIKRKVLSLE